MTYPIDRLLNYLRTVDEVQILELLDLSTEDILNRFHDRVASRRHYLEKELEVLYEEEDYIDSYDDRDEDS
jgi:hypothetical protein